MSGFTTSCVELSQASLAASSEKFVFSVTCKNPTLQIQGNTSPPNHKFSLILLLPLPEE
jgi:hypothetical protein